jgi:serine/threonine-protein kinase
VLDWGIAVSMEDDGSGRFPLASEADQTVGTPAYMAPEMLGADAATLSERTDVYLLGAILYEIVEGDPPHRCDSIETFVESVASSNPHFRTDVSDELERIVRRAMAGDPEDRFDDVESLRLAVQGFLRHRGSTRLAGEASERLAALHSAIATTPEDRDAHRMQVYNLFSESRFGFQEALAQWADNEEAKHGRREAVIAVAEFELDQGEHRAASLLLSEIDDPPAPLLARIEAAQAASDAERAELAQLRRLGRDHDMRIGQRTRWFLISVLGVLWTILPLVLAGRPAPEDHWGIFWFPVVFLVLGGVFAIWARESLMKTAFNRRASGVVAFAMVAQAVLALGTMTAEIPVRSVLPIEFFLWFCVTGMITITMEWRLWPAALGYLATFFGVAWVHAHAGADYVRQGLYLMAAGHLCLTLTVLVIWRPHSLRRAPDEEYSGRG